MKMRNKRERKAERREGKEKRSHFSPPPSSLSQLLTSRYTEDEVKQKKINGCAQ
jgi:hypothetical protein